MVDQDDQHWAGLQRGIDVHQSRARALEIAGKGLGIGFDNPNAIPELLGECRRDLEGRAFPEIVDIRLER